MKALVSTIEPVDGGVPSMTRWICSKLRGEGIEPVLAWYAPWRNQPELSVPIYKVLNRVPGAVARVAFDEYEGSGIGSWLPELEFTHYLPQGDWRGLIEHCDLHLVVSGNPLAATPFALSKIPFLGWIATPWAADRTDRIKRYSTIRKTLDMAVTRPISVQLEKRILRSEYGDILPLSRYTLRKLERISGRKLGDTMLMPVDTTIFKREKDKTALFRIGFSGRYCDPRKNIELLLQSACINLSRGINHEVILVGDRDPKGVSDLIKQYGLEKVVKTFSHMEPNELSQLLQTLDIFVIPSHQEGLCISALEAMACGVPIVSTYCGGPEEFVINGQTGYLVENRASDLAEVIRELCADRIRRNKISDGAVDWIEKNATEESSKRIFLKHLTELGRRAGL